MRFFNKKLNMNIEPSVSETKTTHKSHITARKILLSKNNGNISSFIYGIAFLTLVAVWMLFSYRLILINAMFDFIDDSLTSSTLAMAVIDIDEYGRSNQLIIHEQDTYNEKKYTENTSSYGTDTSGEAGILLSYLNKNSSILSTIETLPSKEITNFDNRKAYTSDSYLINSVSLGINSLASNFTNGNSPTFNLSGLGTNLKSVDTANYTAKVHKTTGNNASSFGTTGNLAISYDNILNNSFLKNFVVSDMEISNISIYNVYRANLAELKTYQYNTNWFNVEYNDDKIKSVTPAYVYQDEHAAALNSDGDTFKAGVQGATLDSVSNFIYVKEPSKLIWTSSKPADDLIIGYYPNETSPTLWQIENTNYGKEYQNYKIELTQFTKQIEFYNWAKGKGNAGTYSNCFINTHSTNQHSTNTSTFKYAFSNGTTLLETKSTDTPNTTITTSNKLTGKAPIAAIGIFRYIQSTEPNTYKYSNTQSYSYITSGDSSDSVVLNSGTTLTGFTNGISSFTLNNCKSAGKTVTDTSVYMELTFTIKTYPTMPGAISTLQNNYQTVTVSRLISIALNE